MSKVQTFIYGDFKTPLFRDLKSNVYRVFLIILVNLKFNFDRNKISQKRNFAFNGGSDMKHGERSVLSRNDLEDF